MGIDEVIRTDDEVMNMLRDYINEDVDVRALPYDCPRRAAERMRDDYTNGLECDYEDVITVFGEPNTGITVPQTQEEAGKYFSRRLEEIAEKNAFLDITRENRIIARKEKYQSAEISLLD